MHNRIILQIIWSFARLIAGSLLLRPYSGRTEQQCTFKKHKTPIVSDVYSDPYSFAVVFVIIVIIIQSGSFRGFSLKGITKQDPN